MKSTELKPLKDFKSVDGPVVLVIMDGVGIGSKDEKDGVFMANTPVLDALLHEPVSLKIKAHGRAVGLPTDDDMGNSEVGHNALGAGRVFAQGAKLVNDAFETGEIFKGKSWQEIEKRSSQGGTLHLIGLVSDGNVHSHIKHLHALLKKSLDDGIRKVRIHGLLDGRDVAPKSALTFFKPLEALCEEMSTPGHDFRIGSGGGRMLTTMDRYEADWTIVETGWKAHVLGEGRQFTSAVEAIEAFYKEDPDLIDQYMESFVIADSEGPVGTIEDGDSVVLFNFRGDRAIEISRAFEEADFKAFDRKRFPEVFFAGMMQYDGDASIPQNYLVEPPTIDGTIGEYLCGSGVSSYAISETQKFGHVTYFWNGNKSGYIDMSLEKYVEIESDRVTFDLRPWMKAAEITDQVSAAVESGDYKFIRLNYANGDMVGHTGVAEAIRIGVETVDICLGRLLKAIKKKKGIAVVTADHGNADCMWTEKNGEKTPMVAHTKNPVPFIIKDYSGMNKFIPHQIENGGLANVAATLCMLLGFEPPKHYDKPLVVIEK